MADRSLPRAWPPADEGQVLCDEDGRILEVDADACRLTGFGREDLVSKKLADLSADPEFNVREALRVVPPEGVVTLEGGLRTQDGQTRAFRLRWRFVERGGKRRALLSLGRAKRASDRLPEDPALARALLGSSIALSIVCDPEGRIQIFSPSCEELTGFTFAELRGKAVWDVLAPPPAKAESKALFSALRGSDFPRTRESQWLTRSGEVKPILWYETVIQGSEGAIRHVVAIGSDLTGARQDMTRRACVESLLKYSADAILSVDFDGRIRSANNSAGLLFGFDPAVPEGATLASLLAADRPEDASAIVARARAGESSFTLDTEVVRPDGARRQVEISGAPIRDAEGRPEAACLVIRDVSERKKAETQLRRSRKLLEEAEGIARLGSWEWAVPENALFWSDALYDIFEVDRERFVPSYEAYLERIVAEDSGRVKGIIEQVLKEGSDFAFGHSISRPGGDRRVLYCRGRVMRDSTGAPIRMIGTSQDVTEDWEKSAALHRSEERFRTVAYLANDIIYERDLASGRMEWFGDMASRLGYTAEEFPASFAGWADLIHPEERLSIIEATEASGRLGNPFSETYRIRRRDGDYAWLEDRGMALKVEDGASGKWIGAARDVTQERRGKARERAEHDVSRLLARASDFASTGPALLSTLCSWLDCDTGILWTIDPAERVMRFLTTWQRSGMEPPQTEAVLRELRFPPGKGLAGRVWETRAGVWVPDVATDPNFMLGPLAKLERVHSALGLPVVVEEEIVGVLEFFTADVREPDELAMKTLRAVAGQIGQFIERERGQNEIRDLNRSLERRVSERTRTLEEALRDMDSFSYSVAHDLRAPLRAMEGYSNILIEESAQGLGEEGAHSVHRIIQAAKRMDDLIQGLLTYSKLSRSEVAGRPIDLNETLSNVEKEVASDLESRGGTLEVERPLPVVLGIEGVLHQAILNLVTNAIKFVAKDTRPQVRVRASIVGKNVRVHVEDNGIGIAPEYRDRVFRILERLHGQGNYPGVGLGLSIVKRAVEKMGGQVGFESEVGKGSRFWIELPRAPEGG